MNIRKKAQMEMVGLVVIVILLTLGMLFLAIFSFKSGTQKKIFTREGLAYSSMSAIMKTTVSEGVCEGNFKPSIGQQLLEDCAQNYFNSPDGYSNYNCDNKHSCVFLEETLIELLEDTLGQWNKRYQLKSSLIRSSGTEPEILLNVVSDRGDCPPTRERDSSGLFPIQVRDAGLVENVLYICD